MTTMEAMHHHAMEEEEVEVPQLVHKGSRVKRLDQPAFDAGNVARTSSTSSSDSKTSSSSHSSGVEDVASDVAENVNDVKLQWSPTSKNFGNIDVDIPKIVSTDGNLKESIVSELKAPISANKDEKALEVVIDEENDLVLGPNDEEVIELEFEKAVEKAHTHTAYCPNCRSQITRVVLRRKISRPPLVEPSPGPSPAPPNPELFGCLSCFRFFVPSGNGLNRFWIFGSNDDERPPPVRGELESGEDVLDPSVPPVENPNTEHVKPVSVFNLWGIFGGRGGKLNTGNQQGYTNDTPGNVDQPEHKQETSSPSVQPEGSVVINIGGGSGSVGESSAPVEILKCIVYGGLLESITSLGLVSSAASSGATKLNIIALCLANLVSGLFLIGQNLMDLISESGQHGRDRYYESLGRRGHFLLHATFSIISFLVFGLVPPAMFAFTELWEVGVASFACIFILAIAKAYVESCKKFSGYIKIVLYYVTMAVMVSGIAYVMGDQVKDLMEKFGWFETNPVGPSFVPDMNFATQAWSSY